MLAPCRTRGLEEGRRDAHLLDFCSRSTRYASTKSPWRSIMSPTSREGILVALKRTRVTVSSFTLTPSRFSSSSAAAAMRFAAGVSSSG